MLAFDCSQVPRTPSSGRLEEKLITVRKGTCSEVVQKVKKKKKKSDTSKRHPTFLFCSHQKFITFHYEN